MTLYDLAIVGGGPAGLAAVATAGVRNKSTILFEANDFSPRLKKAERIDNYLGLPGISGTDLMERFKEQALAFKPEVVTQKVIGIHEHEGGFMLATAGEVYQAKAVILAVGVSHTKALGGERAFLGKGVSYCATCDGFLYKGKRVAVISYVPHAVDEVEFLAELASEVLYFPQFHHAGELSFQHANITVMEDKPLEIKGTERVTGLSTTGEYLGVQGIFIFREADPVETLCPDLQLRGTNILVDEQMATNVEGIFAAGDCTGQPWQISRATGEGTVAVLSAVKYIDNKAKEKA